MNTELKCFKSFRDSLFYSLSSRGFLRHSDVATKLIDINRSLQVVIAGNDYFVSIDVQYCMPNAAKYLSSRLKAIGIYHKFNYKSVYRPILSIGLDKIASQPIKEALSKPNWVTLSSNVDEISNIINDCVNGNSFDIFMDFRFWPSEMNDIDLAIFLIGFYKIAGREVVDLVKRRYKFSGSGESINIYENIANDVIAFGNF
jgi:hypothetical protein